MDRTPTRRRSVDRMLRARLTKLGVVAALVAVVIAAIVVATGAGSSAPPPPGSDGAIDREIGTLLGGIPQHADALGRSTAPVTLEWFGDLECPYCREFTLGALPAIIRTWVRGGELRIEYRSMETATHDPETFIIQQVAALAAGMQNKLWYFIVTFYHEQGEEDSGYVTPRYIHRLAQQVPGLSLTRWEDDRNNPDLVNQIEADGQAVKSAGLTGTPGFMIGRTGGSMTKLRSDSLTSTKFFDAAIRYMLSS
jgi:protein-disulfide isomerase